MVVDGHDMVWLHMLKLSSTSNLKSGSYCIVAVVEVMKGERGCSRARDCFQQVSSWQAAVLCKVWCVWHKAVILVGNAFRFTRTDAPEDITERRNEKQRSDVHGSETTQLQIDTGDRENGVASRERPRDSFAAQLEVGMSRRWVKNRARGPLDWE